MKGRSMTRGLQGRHLLGFALVGAGSALNVQQLIDWLRYTPA